MLFRKPKHVILVRKNSLTITDGGEAGTAVIPLPPTSLSFLEVIDPNAIVSDIRKMLETFSRQKRRAVVLLGDDIVFSTVLQSTDPTGQKKETFLFFNNIPLLAKNIAGKTLRATQAKRLFAVNQEIITAVHRGLREAGWKVDAIVPENLFWEPDQAKRPSKKDVSSVLANHRLLHLSNFLLTPFLHNQPETLFVPQSSLLHSLLAYAPLTIISMGVALLSGILAYMILSGGLL